MTEDAKLAAKKGAALLDERHPGWAQKIDRERLDMEHCDRCVIGQLYGWYMAERVLEPTESEYEFGFYAPKDAQTWEQLDEAWLDEIDRRTP